MKTKKDPFFLSEDDRRVLNQLNANWTFNANEMFVKHFGHRYDGNNIIGAGVQIYRKIGNKLYKVMSWYGGGATYEQEAFDEIESKIQNLVLVANYNC